MTEVVAYKPRRQEAPVLRYAELRLGEDFELEMTLVDDQGGGVVILEFAFSSKSPKAFDMGVLRQNWNRWREASEIAS
jgi:hypothetical protein